MDARKVASSHAQSLQFLCEISQLMINNSIMLNLGSLLLSSNALSPSDLELTVNTTFNQIVAYAKAVVSGTLYLASTALSSDLYMSGLGTNAIAYRRSNLTNILSTAVAAYEMPDNSICYCSPSKSCQIPAAIYWNSCNEFYFN